MLRNLHELKMKIILSQSTRTPSQIKDYTAIAPMQNMMKIQLQSLPEEMLDSQITGKQNLWQ